MFTNKDGQLSVYALNCGYIQQANTKGLLCDSDYKHNSIELARDGGVYSVKAYVEGKRTNWDCFDSLKDARIHFKKLAKINKFKLVEVNKNAK